MTAVARVGVEAVPGAELRYRLVGDERTDLPPLVFENGWAASYDMWAWIERELEPHAQMLFYNHAGIGGSTRNRPQTVEGLSRQLAALLDALELRGPVVAVGQSFGGLLCSAHAVQIPDRIAALVQVDPTAEQDDPAISFGLKAADWAARFATLMAVLRLPDPVFSAGTADLPEAAGAELRRVALGSAPSWRSARAELALLPQMREIAARPAPQPRLVISASRHTEPAGLMRRLVSEERARANVEDLQAHHRLTAARGVGSRWEQLPYTHGGIVFTRDGARDTAARTLEFVSELPAARR